MHVSTASRRRSPALARALRWLCFGALPVTLVLLVVGEAAHEEILALDFHHAFWPAGRSILDGTFAYDQDLRGHIPFVYPPLTAVLLAPLALLPVGWADALFTLGGVAGVVLGLRLLGVRDVRCLGAAFLWPPVLSAVQTGNLSLVLVAGLALAWSVRATTIALGVTIALLVSSKLFLWPLLLWLAFSRRWRALGCAVVAFGLLNAGGWAIADAGSVADYVDLLRRLSASESPESYTVKALLSRLGTSDGAAGAVSLLLVASWVVLWWRRRDDDRRSFALAVAIAVIASPIVWLHYLSLLLVPVALVSRRLSWIWLVPLVTFVCPGTGSGSIGQTALAVAVVLLTAASVTFGEKRHDRLGVSRGRRALPRSA